MSDARAARVAVYLDFDNVVISNYDRVHGRGSWSRDGARNHAMSAEADGGTAAKLAAARVDLGAILDYVSSWGTVAITRAYADWAVPANAAYRSQLVNRAVDLVQLFTLSAGLKNGADIRLAVDVMEDLFRLPDVTHVVIVAGDSDYIALAQRCRRLGRVVVGIGVEDATSPALKNACDVFTMYGQIPKDEIEPIAPRAAASGPSSAAPEDEPEDEPADDPKARQRAEDRATALLVRALTLVEDTGDDDWQNAGAIKSQMLRLDPAFKEKALGHSSFRGFLEAREKGWGRKIESDPDSGPRNPRYRLRG